MKAHEKWAVHRPRIGDCITFNGGARWYATKGTVVGFVTSVDGEICHHTVPPAVNSTGFSSFIWCFSDRLNALHDWPSKHPVTEDV